MTPLQFRDALARLELTQTGFARLTGKNARTVRRWASGEAEVPQWVIVLLAGMKAKGRRTSSVQQTPV